MKRIDRKRMKRMRIKKQRKKRMNKISGIWWSNKLPPYSDMM